MFKENLLIPQVHVFDCVNMEAVHKPILGNELYEACIQGSLAAVTTIVSRSRATNPSWSPPFSSMLYIATSKDYPAIVQYCLENAAPITPKIMEILLLDRAKQTYTLLLDLKAVDVNYDHPWWGDILSHFAIADDFEWVHLCLKHGADPNQNVVYERKSVLAAAAEWASVEMAALLIKHGARVIGCGAIVMAGQEGKVEMAKMLLDEGADINEIGIEHPTDVRYKKEMGSALHRAVEKGHEAMVRFWLERGADVRLKDPMGRTPAALARENGIVKMLNALA